MKKSNLLISATAALVALIAVSGIAMSTFAADDEDSKIQERPPMAGMKGGFMAAGEEAQAALEAGDYQAWKEAMPENCPFLEKINEDNFSRLAEANSLMKQAREIYEELGLDGPGMGFGSRGGHGKGPMRGPRPENGKACPDSVQEE